MARFRSYKNELRALLESGQWRENLDAMAAGGTAAVGPLMSFLAREPVLRLRAAIALGRTTGELHKTHPDAARDVMRRLNWRMSEESGNIGWGVPEAIGEVLAQCPALARDFHRIFFSTLLDLGFDDNYVDNDVLRRSCYFAIGRFVHACPQYGEQVRPLLRKGLRDTDAACTGYAAWALGLLPPDPDDVPALRRLAEQGATQDTGQDARAVCVVTDGDDVLVLTPQQMAADALKGSCRLAGQGAGGR